MAQEADFYTAEEAAKVLGLPVRRVFGMLCSGELEGHQDEWARWLVPASAVQGAERSLEPSDLSESPEDDAESSTAPEDETMVRDAAATTVLDGGPLWEPPDGAKPPSGEETTQEEDEAPAGDSPAPRTYAEEGGGAETTAEGLPFDQHQEAPASDATLHELVERLDAATAKTRELRHRLELAEATEAALRENLEQEFQRVDRENAQAGRHEAETERLEKESAAGRGEGFWRGLFGG